MDHAEARGVALVANVAVVDVGGRLAVEPEAGALVRDERPILLRLPVALVAGADAVLVGEPALIVLGAGTLLLGQPVTLVLVAHALLLGEPLTLQLGLACAHAVPPQLDLEPIALGRRLRRERPFELGLLPCVL